VRRQITRLGLSFILAGLVGVLLGFALFVNGLGSGLNAVEGVDPRLGQHLQSLRPYYGFITMALSVPVIICGIGLRRHRRYGKIMATVFAVLALPGVPLGTLFGIWLLLVLRQARRCRVFEADLFLERYADESPEDHATRVPDQPSGLISAGLVLLYISLSVQLLLVLILFGLFGGTAGEGARGSVPLRGRERSPAHRRLAGQGTEALPSKGPEAVSGHRPSVLHIFPRPD